MASKRKRFANVLEFLNGSGHSSKKQQLQVTPVDETPKRESISDEYSVEDFDLHEGLDEPVLIGEFHFGALDRGSLHVGVRGASSQSDRGVLFKNYLQGTTQSVFRRHTLIPIRRSIADRPQ